MSEVADIGMARLKRRLAERVEVEEIDPNDFRLLNCPCQAGSDPAVPMEPVVRFTPELGVELVMMTCPVCLGHAHVAGGIVGAMCGGSI